MSQKVQANDIKITHKKILQAAEAHSAINKQVKSIKNLILPIRIIFNYCES